MKIVPYPDRIIRLANSWGKQSRSKQFGNKLEFLNRNKVRYDWDNEEIEEEEALVEPPPAAHPGILAEIPGVELEADRKMLPRLLLKRYPSLTWRHVLLQHEQMQI